MERHISCPRTRAVLGCALTVSSILAFGTSCRSTRSEVPPHRPFMTDGRQAPPINFSGNSSSPSDGLPPVSAGQGSSYGTPAPGASNYGAPTANAFGAPGTTTLGSLPGGDATKPGMTGSYAPSAGAPSGKPGQPSQAPTPNPFGPQ